MLTVTISINGVVKVLTRAVRQSPRGEIIDLDTMCRYELNEGKVVRHRYGDGPVALAIRMLETHLPHVDTVPSDCGSENSGSGSV